MSEDALTKFITETATALEAAHEANAGLGAATVDHLLDLYHKALVAPSAPAPRTD